MSIYEEMLKEQELKELEVQNQISLVKSHIELMLLNASEIHSIRIHRLFE